MMGRRAMAVPTIAESGYPGFETSQWYGLMAPAGTPEAIVKRLQSELVIALKSPEGTKRMREMVRCWWAIHRKNLPPLLPKSARAGARSSKKQKLTSIRANPLA